MQDYVTSVAVSHDGQWIVSGSSDLGVRFWNPKSGTAQFTLVTGHRNPGPLSPVDPTPRTRVDSLPFQSRQLTSALPEACWQPVRVILRLGFVCPVFSENTSAVDRGLFREVHYRFLISVSAYNLSCVLPFCSSILLLLADPYPDIVRISARGK